MTMQEADVKMFKPVARRLLEGGRLPGNRPLFDKLVPAPRHGGKVISSDYDRIAQTIQKPPVVTKPPADVERLVERLASAGFRSRSEIIAEAEAAGEIGGDADSETSGASALVGEVEQLLAIELRTELLKVLQDVGPRVLSRLHVCRGCGELFLAKRRGGTVKWCPACRK